MPPTSIRPARPTDDDAVLRLCLENLDPADADTESLRPLLRTQPDLSVGYVAVDGADIVGAAYGTLTPHEPGAAAVTLIVVAEAYRRQSVGTALLPTLEDRLRSLGATEISAGGGQPRFWWPGIDRRATDALAFFSDQGYEEEDSALNLVVDLGAADLAPRPVGSVVIRRLGPAEWPAFLDWMNETWDDPWGDEATTTLGHDPVSCFVAQLDGRYVGFAAYDTNRPGWFGPMGSSPSARGLGLGSELLRTCLRDYVDLGRTSCEIGWVGPVEFYAKAVGAVPGREFAQLRKDLAR